MKVSLNLAEEDVEFLDAYASTHGLRTRSEVVQRAIEVLRVNELRAAYTEAWSDWATNGDIDLWEPVVGDGL